MSVDLAEARKRFDEMMACKEGVGLSRAGDFVNSPAVEAFERFAFKHFGALIDLAEAQREEIDLLRARAPRRFILARASEWVRLFREVHGYLRTCHHQHGTDWEGRNHAMRALTEAMEFVGASDAAREVKLEELREAEARAHGFQKAERT